MAQSNQELLSEQNPPLYGAITSEVIIPREERALEGLIVSFEGQTALSTEVEVSAVVAADGRTALSTEAQIFRVPTGEHFSGDMAW